MCICSGAGAACIIREYAIKKHLTHQQKERLAAAPELLAALLPDTAAWGVEADSCTLHP